MPIQLNEVETNVQVEAPGGGGEAQHKANQPEALSLWQELAQRRLQLAARTAAWGFDD